MISMSFLTIVTFFTTLSARNIQEDMIRPQIKVVYNIPNTKFLSKSGKEETFASSWSRLVVFKMHYNCEGRLVRQEVSRAGVQTGVARIPGEDPELFSGEDPKNIVSEDDVESGLNTIREEDNSNRYSVSNNDNGIRLLQRETTDNPPETPSVKQEPSSFSEDYGAYNAYKTLVDNTKPEPESETRVFFRSIPSRMRGTQPTRKPTAIQRPTNTAANEQAMTAEITFGPDTIIDMPIIPCPVGQNEDSSGMCRPVFN